MTLCSYLFLFALLCFGATQAEGAHLIKPAGYDIPLNYTDWHAVYVDSSKGIFIVWNDSVCAVDPVTFDLLKCVDGFAATVDSYFQLYSDIAETTDYLFMLISNGIGRVNRFNISDTAFYYNGNFSSTVNMVIDTSRNLGFVTSAHLPYATVVDLIAMSEVTTFDIFQGGDAFFPISAYTGNLGWAFGAAMDSSLGLLYIGED